MTRPNPDDQKQPKTKLKRRAIPVFFLIIIFSKSVSQQCLLIIKAAFVSSAGDIV